MKPRNLSPYPTSGLVLLLMSAVVLIIVAFTDRGDFTSATLVLLGFACFVGGLFLTLFAKLGDPIPAFVSLLPTQAIINQARFMADLGITGNAHFVPGTTDSPAKVMQYNPVSEFHPPDLAADGTFLLGADTAGMVSVPAGIPILQMLEDDHHLTIPESEPALFETIQEVLTDILEVADSVTLARNADHINITLHQYRFLAGCTQIRNESPKCCTMAPCPVCSLIASLLALGFSQTVAMLGSAPEKGKNLVLVFSVVSDGLVGS